MFSDKTQKASLCKSSLVEALEALLLPSEEVAKKENIEPQAWAPPQGG